MLITEFESLTGIRPPQSMWAEIAKAYHESDMNMFNFCKAYELNVNGIAERIQHLVDSSEIKQVEDLKLELLKKEKRIAQLQKKLDKKSYRKGTNLSQDDYECMEEYSRILTDIQAKKFLHIEFGFMLKKIEIVHEVYAYERINFHSYQVKGKYQRSACVEFYGDCDEPETDDIRFNCAGRAFELINGKIIPYERPTVVIIS